MLTEKCAPPFCQFCFGLVLTPKNIYRLLELSFLLRLSTHPSNMGGKLSNYYLYHEEAPFYLDVHPQPFHRPFIIFLSLSSQ